MPTPFMHMRVAEQLAGLAREPGGAASELAALLRAQWPAFVLGNIAPDYQALCGVRRSATHFYHLPPSSRGEAVHNLLLSYPELANPRKLPAAQSAFLTGYLAHLALDLIWHFDVVAPYFLESPQIPGPREGHVIHLVLLAFLDMEARQELQPQVGAALRAAEPDRWADFAPDPELSAWRDYVAAQLEAGAVSRTAEIYAARLHMEPEAFAGKLADGPWRREELFGRVPVSAVQERLQTAVPDCLELVTAYVRGDMRAEMA